MRFASLAVSFAIVLAAARARAQPEPAPAPTTPDPKETDPRFERFDRAPALPEPEPPETPPPPPPPPAEPPPAKAISEGRVLVSAYNEGFQWGISPGIAFSGKQTGFALGVALSYGIDLGSVIVVPGVHGTALFLDDNVWIGMPTGRLIVPIDRVGPFVEAGAGFGHVSGIEKSGLAWMAGGGVAVYFTHVAIGAQASYQAITGTGFEGWGIGPILAIGF